MPLTDTRIRSLKPRETPYKVADGGGLYIEVKPSGAKLWRLRYRHISTKLKGKRTETILAIGQYPAVNLSAARAERDRIKALIKKGIHPARQRKLDKIRQANEHANTFRAVALEWLDRNAIKWAPTTLRLRRNALESEVFPHVGDLPINHLEPAHVLDILQRVEKKAPTMALLVKQSIGAICRLAITTLRANIDPTAPLRDALKPHKQQHSKPLSTKDIPAFFKSLQSQTLTTRTAFDLMWLTLARSSEVLKAKWSEFDLDAGLWVIAPHRMKMREVHRVPLPRQAVKVLRELHKLTGDGPFVFPNRDSRNRPASHNVLRKAVFTIGWQGRFSPHGIRSTASTILNELGHRPDVIESQLAHAERNKVRAAYNRSDHLQERAKMMQQWADYLDDLRDGESKIVTIRRGA